jgi:glycyl-tRNA synthetase beta chain
LGSLYDKTQRISKLAQYIAKQINCNSADVKRAAELCKCDLMTDMVGEFPSLQGIMGRYYALNDNEKPEVADAIDQHYRPRFSGDHLPQTKISQAIALADRIDSLLGIFALGQIPTGDKDPYALRRASLGVLRILIENKIDLNLDDLLKQAAASFDKAIKASDAIQSVIDFIFERLRAYYQDKGITPDVLDAVTSLSAYRPVDIDKRIKAVNHFRKLPEAESLAAANKRIGNILKKVNGKIPVKLDPALFEISEETVLFDLINSLSDDIDPLLAESNYEKTLQHLARLRQPVDNYFDKVMVMADDTKVRNNRIAMLNQLHSMFLKVADISRLQNQG